MILLILPTQLFSKKYLRSIIDEYDVDEIVLWEHSHYFTKYKFNKKKLILHRASMKYYYNYLRKLTKVPIKYINFNKKYTFAKSNNYLMFDPIDNISLPKNIEYLESPNFLLSLEQLELYRENTDKFVFNNFYMFMKNLLPDLIPAKYIKMKSQDKLNRDKLTSDVKLPRQYKAKSPPKSVISYVNKYFKNNYGNTSNFIWPYTHSQANSQLGNFLKNKINLFGQYQDSISQHNSYLFHSLLSIPMNIGLITPSIVLTKLFARVTKTTKVNSVEGFLRQLFWREYQRYTFIYLFDKNPKKFNSKEYFGKFQKSKLSGKWYLGELGIPPVDDAIRDGFDSGYLHHILRLMVVGNYMMLSGIKSSEGFNWFMEFSCDSYEWVMSQNVLDMVFFVSGGKSTRKPYISSSNYILNMSDYKKENNNESWNDIWDDKYKDFLKKNKSKLYKFRYHFKL